MEKYKDLERAIESAADVLRQGSEAITEGNTIFGIIIARVVERLPIKEQEVFDVLVELVITQLDSMTAYLFLVKHPDQFRAVGLGCPTQMREHAT